MNKFTFLVLALAIGSTAKAQIGCASYSLQKNDSLVFTRLLPPPYDPAIRKLDLKEKVAYLKKQGEDIKNGSLKLREGKSSITILEKENTPTGFKSKAQIAIINPPNRFLVNTIYECINDTLYVHPENAYSEVENIGVTYTGPVVFPMKMKKGDLLPDNKNVTLTFKRTGSMKFMLPYITSTTTTHHIGSDGREVYKSFENTYANKEVTNNFSSMNTVETIYANREVTGDTTISYKGKSYKGYIIKCFLLTTTSIEVTSDYFQKSMQRVINRKMAKAARKLSEDESGVFTTFIEDVFVPELGVVSSLMTKKDGSFFSKSMLAE